VPAAASTPATEKPIAAAPPKNRMKITRTKSELGYVFWVLREFGDNPSYALFDTWREAMDEAARRIKVGASSSESYADAAVLIPA
jgi:hypothetical protein